MIKARPSELPVVCISESCQSLLNLVRGLRRCGAKLSGGLLYCNGFCLSFKISPAEAEKILPIVCEHSDAVCVGRFYPELLSEHSQSPRGGLSGGLS